MDKLSIELYTDARKTIRLFVAVAFRKLITNMLAKGYAAALYSSTRRRVEPDSTMHHILKYDFCLDIAETELPAFIKGCLYRRISTIEEPQRESTVWYIGGNKRQKGVDWQFSVGDVRIRLKYLNPTIKNHV